MLLIVCSCLFNVTSREGRVSRNFRTVRQDTAAFVTSREGRVSRNFKDIERLPATPASRPARGV